MQAWWRQHCHCDEVVLASARDGDGVEAIAAWALARLPLGPTLYPKDAPTDAPERFFVAELIRGQAFNHYRQDVPYCLQARALSPGGARLPAEGHARPPRAWRRVLRRS